MKRLPCRPARFARCPAPVTRTARGPSQPTGGSVAFTLRCYASAGAPIAVRVVVTGDYLLTLHAEQLSLPALLEPELLGGAEPAIRRLLGA